MAKFWIKNRPCKTTRITSPFGYRMHPVTGSKSMHNGTDYSPTKKVGENIWAIAAGKVILAQYSDTAGYYIKIKHSNDWVSVYMHMQKGLKVKTGQTVKAKQTLGRMGSTGTSTAEHLHNGLMNAKGEYVDPEKEYKKIGTTVLPRADKCKKVQRLIGTDADGIWGPKSKTAYRAYIKKSANVKKLQTLLNTWTSPKLEVDGIVGRLTTAAMLAIM